MLHVLFISLYFLHIMYYKCHWFILFQLYNIFHIVYDFFFLLRIATFFSQKPCILLNFVFRTNVTQKIFISFALLLFPFCYYYKLNVLPGFRRILIFLPLFVLMIFFFCYGMINRIDVNQFPLRNFFESFIFNFQSEL
jgi:hypothetical protein